MVQDDIDLALRYGVPADSEMVARVLAPSRRVVCAAPSLIARDGGPATPEAWPTADAGAVHGAGADAGMALPQQRRRR
jgi:DNA-binding transcriptional LysR family regulator